MRHLDYQKAIILLFAMHYSLIACAQETQEISESISQLQKRVRVLEEALDQRYAFDPATKQYRGPYYLNPSTGTHELTPPILSTISRLRGNRSPGTSSPIIAVNDIIDVELTGEVVLRYASFLGLKEIGEDFVVPFTCTVERWIGSDRIELKGQRMDAINSDVATNSQKRVRLVTLKAVVELNDIKSPIDSTHLFPLTWPRTVEEKSSIESVQQISIVPRIRLRSLDGVCFRSWEIAEEFGDW